MVYVPLLPWNELATPAASCTLLSDYATSTCDIHLWRFEFPYRCSSRHNTDLSRRTLCSTKLKPDFQYSHRKRNGEFCSAKSKELPTPEIKSQNSTQALQSKLQMYDLHKETSLFKKIHKLSSRNKDADETQSLRIQELRFRRSLHDCDRLACLTNSLRITLVLLRYDSSGDPYKFRALNRTKTTRHVLSFNLSTNPQRAGQTHAFRIQERRLRSSSRSSSRSYYCDQSTSVRVLNLFKLNKTFVLKLLHITQAQ